jgi:ribosomal protein S18 acetylase RimI-like enzyme
VLYRVYQPGDFPFLYVIEEACFQPPLRFSRAHIRRLVGQPNGVTWVAEDDGQLCAFGIAEWAAEESRVTAYIQTLEVLAEVRHRGVGRELLQRMEQSAREAGAMEIWLHVDAQNPAAIRLYERFAYALQGREPDYYGRGRTALMYAKSLGA